MNFTTSLYTYFCSHVIVLTYVTLCSLLHLHQLLQGPWKDTYAELGSELVTLTLSCSCTS